MRMGRLFLTLAFVSFSVIFVSAGVLAQGLAGYQRPLITLMLDNRAELKLSQDQIRGLESLRQNFQEEATQRAKEMEKLETELDRLLSRETVDMPQLEATFKKGATLMAETHLGRIRTIEQGKALLNPDQRKAFFELLEKEKTSQTMMPGMMGGMMGGQGMGGREKMGSQGMMGGQGGMMGGQTPPAEATPDSRTVKSEAGGITVEAAFQDARSQGQLVFQVKLDTHSVELGQYDLAKLALLRNDQGRSVLPRAWQAGSARGHHISGTLAFADQDPSGAPIIDSNTRYLDLVIREVGQVKERVLRWNF